MEIQEATSYTFYFSRLFGLAPFLIKRSNSKTRIDEIRVSLLICFYSITLLSMTVYLTVRFIFLDANSKTPIRMRTATGKFVTVLDVCVVVSACICGVFSGIWGVKSIQNVNNKLREADKELSTGINEVRRDKRYNAIMLGFVFLTMTGMIILDVFSKSRNAKKYKKSLEAQNKPTDEVHIEIYFPFYVAYYMLMALHTHFAQTAIGIKRRYRRLNSSLKNIFALKKIIDNNHVSRNQAHRIEVQSTKDKSKATNESNLHGETVNSEASTKPMNKITMISRAIQNEKYTTPVFTTYGKLSLAANALPSTNYFLDRLSYTHAILGEAVYLVSSSCGLTVLALLASCLLHLVSTMYFLFIELLGDTDAFVAGLQLLWCCFHLALLLLIVEPCHMASVEARKTVLIVSDVLRSCKENSVELILHRFWKQLIGNRTYSFTACGLCVIDRQILTSIGGAIATYLVILIQFQNSMGKQ